nr:hypothetical protein [Tanacetum cinerariifolium]
MNRISSRRLSTTTCVLWQCSQNISCVSKGKGLFGPNGERGRKEEVGFDTFGIGEEEIENCDGNGGRGSSIFERGSMLMANGEECLDGWVGAGRGELKGSGVDFRVILLGEIPKESTGEIPKESTFGSRWVVIGDDKKGISDEGWRSNKDGHLS